MRLFLILACLALLGCGGGGGSSSPTTSPSGGGSGNSATPPVINFTLNKSTVFEEGFIIIDAEDSTSGSSGTSIETIDVRQTSGREALRLSDLNSRHWLLLAPRLDFDGRETLSFEITATDYDGKVARESFNIAVIGRRGPGRPVGDYNPPLNLMLGSGNARSNIIPHETVVAKQETGENFEAERETLIFPGWIYPETDLSQEYIIQSDEVFTSVDQVQVGDLGLFSVFAPTLTILNQVDNRFDWLVLDDQNITGPGTEDDRKYRLQDSVDIDSPCYIAPIVSLPQDYIIVGQRDEGFSVISLDEERNEAGFTRSFDSNIEFTFGQDFSLCHILQTSLPDRPHPNGVGVISQTGMIAVDYKSNNLVLISGANTLDDYHLIDVVPLDTGTDDVLKVVGVTSDGSPSTVPRWMAVLLTNGEHEGIHRLILITQDRYDGNKLMQTRYELGDGVPIELLVGSFGGVGLTASNGGADDLVVIRSTSETSLFFNNIGSSVETTTDLPIFDTPLEFEIGTGAASAVSIDNRDFKNDFEEILVSFSDTGEIRAFLADENVRTNPDPYE